MITQTENKLRRVKNKVSTVIVVMLVTGLIAGFVTGRCTAPEKTLTLTKTVEAPVYESDILPDTTEVFLYDVPLSDSLQRYIYELCADENVPVTLVMAMIEHESGFNPEIVSSTDDYGLMQINICNHKTLTKNIGITDLLDPIRM